MSGKSRGWCFTDNQCLESTLEAIRHFPKLKYAIVGRERAPTTDHEHFQGYFYFENPRPMPRKHLPGCHLVIARGTPEQNRTYCSKEGNVVLSIGNPIDCADTIQIMTDMIMHYRFKDAYELNPGMFISKHKQMISAANLIRPPPPHLSDVCGLFVWGDKGVGKSRGCDAAYPGHYDKDESTWWDDYNGQDAVVFDEAQVEFVDAHVQFFNKWADYKPFRAQVKGSYVLIRPKVFIIITNMPPDAFMTGARQQVREAFFRRFKQVHMEKGDEFPTL